MKIINDISEISDDFVITIGNFDGVHLGHQTILKHIKEKSEKENKKFCVITFIPHPVQILSPRNNFLLNSYQERRELIKNYGVDYLLEVDFNRDRSTQSPDDFLKNEILKNKKLSHFYVGHDFAFGANKSGDYNFISNYCKSVGVSVTLLPQFVIKDELKVSSSEIRRHLLDGDVDRASTMLGRDYFLNGNIVKGAGRGKMIGIPTANIDCPEVRLVPRQGVYATRVHFSGNTWNSITNIGFNPTFVDTNKLSIETHILDFSNDIYGTEMRVDFVKRIRDEKKFATVNDLISQITSDIVKAREILK